MKTDSPLILAIDAGTSSTRVLAFDSTGKTVGPIAQRAYTQTTTQDGGVFTGADALLELTAQCLDETLHNVSDAPIAAVAMSCFWHSLLGVGEDDAPRTPLFSWADNRAAPFVKTLREKLGEDAAHARTGCLFHASFWPAKLLWLQSSQPELFDGKTRWMSFGEYLALKWCGGARVSLSMASGTGLFNQNACDWDEETLSFLPISRAALSPLCDANDALNAPLPNIASTRNAQNTDTRATEKSNASNAIIATENAASTRSENLAAARWPQLQNAKWFSALGDGACSNIGSGCADAESEKRGGKKTRIALNVGTSGALRVVLRDFSGAPPRGLFRYRLDARRSVLGGALSNGGNVLMWARANLALPPDAESLIAAMPPDAHGLTILPFLAGERSPNWNDAARFALNGATLDTTPSETYRAILEGASLRFLRVLQLLQTALREENAATQNAASTRAAVALREDAARQIEAPQTAAEPKTGASRSESRETAASESARRAASTRADDARAEVAENQAQHDSEKPSQNAAENVAITRAENDYEIVASGGALSHSATWAQIMADCLNAPLIESKENQASARGAALMALEALGALKNVADLTAERGEVLAPDAAHHAIYLTALQRQNALYEKLFGAT